MWVEKLARNIAILGGLVLVFIALMSVVSIIGRAGIKIGLSSIAGDFELVEAGIAFAVFAFLPLAQLYRSHAQVGVLTNRLGKKANLIIDLISDFLMLLIALILTWQLFLGAVDKYNYHETSFILQFPIWWAYGASLVGLLTWVVVGVYCTVKSFSALKVKIGASN